MQLNAAVLGRELVNTSRFPNLREGSACPSRSMEDTGRMWNVSHQNNISEYEDYEGILSLSIHPETFHFVLDAHSQSPSVSGCILVVESQEACV